MLPNNLLTAAVCCLHYRHLGAAQKDAVDALHGYFANITEIASMHSP
jgi:hypothetical protein